MDPKFLNIIKRLVLLIYSLTLAYLAFTDRYKLFVHHRMLIFIRLAAVCFFIMAIFSSSFAISARVHYHEKLKTPYLLFIIPLILIAMSGSLNNIEGAIAGKQGINLVRNIRKTEVANNIKVDIVIIKPGTYLQQIDSIYSNLDKWVDKKISISGFIYRQEDFTEDQFVIGRYLISCCVADAQVVGLLSTLKDSTLRENEWYKVIGTIEKEQYQDNYIPLIKVEKITPFKAPSSPYVYQQF